MRIRAPRENDAAFSESEFAVSTADRRRFRRLGLRLPVILRRRRETGEIIVLRGVTRDVSTSGFYIETEDANAAGADIHPGESLDLDLTLPPADGVSAYEGRATAIAEVIRVEPIAGDTPRRLGIAGVFREPIKLEY